MNHIKFLEMKANLSESEWVEIEDVKNFAFKAHRDTNHRYGKHPYEVHLMMVYVRVLDFAHLLTHDELVLALKGAFLHDLIEDARITYNEIKKRFGVVLAEIAYALTNNKGRDRSERANDAYYEGIRKIEVCIFIKLCDRLANAYFSKYCQRSFWDVLFWREHKPSSMYYKYQKENMDFINKLHVPDRFWWMGDETFRLLEIKEG